MFTPIVTELPTQTTGQPPVSSAEAKRPASRRATKRRKTCTRADRIEAEVGRLLLLGKVSPRRTGRG